MSAEQIDLQELVTDFQGRIQKITPDEVRKLPDYVDQIRHNGTFTRVSEIPSPGLYIDDTIKDAAEGFAFQYQPGSRIGREDSHNKVFFGRLWTVPREGAERHARVAVKPMAQERLEGLLGELGMFQYLGKLALPTFKAAGVLVGEGGNTSHLMTYFDGPVATMDTVDWKTLSSEEAWDELRFAVDTLSLLHKNMLFHGDLYFRNIGFNETGQTVIVDPELTVSARDYFEEFKGAGIILNQNEERALTKITQLMSQDFSRVHTSIEKSILPLLPKRERPRNGEARLKLYRKHLLEPYKAAISDDDNATSPILRRAYDQMLAQLKRLASQDTI